MPEVSRFYDIIVAMFSVIIIRRIFMPGMVQKMAIEIETLRILEGHLPPRALGLVVEWASQHKEELLQNWELAKYNQIPRKIEPLK